MRGITKKQFKGYRKRLSILGCKTYNDYLKTDHWRELRRRFWKSRIPKQCYVCGSNRGIVPHHWKYNKLGEESLHHLVALCPSCHKGVHQIQRDSYYELTVKEATKEYRRIFLK